MIQIKSSREIELMAEGGRILGATVAMLEREVRPGMSTADLDALAEEFIRGHDGAVPAGEVCVAALAGACGQLGIQ